MADGGHEAMYMKYHKPRGGGGVLRYISDGDVRSPFWGLKNCDLRTFFGFEICSDFFWVRDFGKDFFGG